MYAKPAFGGAKAVPFVQHILPRGFLRIWQSGYLANTCRAARVALARTLLATPATGGSSTDTPATVIPETTTRSTWACPRCGTAMIIGPILSALQLATLTWGFDISRACDTVGTGVFERVVAHVLGGVCVNPQIEPRTPTLAGARTTTRVGADVARPPSAARSAPAHARES